MPGKENEWCRKVASTAISDISIETEVLAVLDTLLPPRGTAHLEVRALFYGILVDMVSYQHIYTFLEVLSSQHRTSTFLIQASSPAIDLVQ